MLRVTNGSVPAYQQAADNAVKSTPGSAQLRLAAPGAKEARASLSSPPPAAGLHPGDVISDQRVQTLQAAMHSSTDLVPTPVIGASRLFGFALGPPSAPAGTVLYREAPLGPVAPPRQAGTSPFSELDVALYASPHIDANQVLVSTTKQSALRGQTRSLTIPRRDREVADVGPGFGPRWSAASPTTRPGSPWPSGCSVRCSSRPSSRCRPGGATPPSRSTKRSTRSRRRCSAACCALGARRFAGLDLAARYLADGAGQQVGGDWFDVFPVAGGRVGLVVGDVIGHDLHRGE